jgi:hypothetical protein
VPKPRVKQAAPPALGSLARGRSPIGRPELLRHGDAEIPCLRRRSRTAHGQRRANEEDWAVHPRARGQLLQALAHERRVPLVQCRRATEGRVLRSRALHNHVAHRDRDRAWSRTVTRSTYTRTSAALPQDRTRREDAEHPPREAGFRLYQGHRGGRTRTCNPRFWRPVLCQLSYAPRVARPVYRRPSAPFAGEG